MFTPKKVLFVLTIVAMLVTSAFATPPALAGNKIPWCHVDSAGGEHSLELPSSALQNAGHMDANGNPLHAGDYAGPCQGDDDDDPDPETCPEGQVLVNGVCTTPDPEDPECAEGQVLVNGVCTTPDPEDPECAEGQYLVNGVCTTPDSPPKVENKASCKNPPDIRYYFTWWVKHSMECYGWQYQPNSGGGSLWTSLTEWWQGLWRE